VAEAYTTRPTSCLILFLAYLLAAPRRSAPGKGANEETSNRNSVMFPIDASLLPSLTTRKALLVVDAQNDFLAEDGALPAKLPIGLPQRIGDLANGFRKSGGDIIWVQSQFESARPVGDEQILVPDTPTRPTAPAPVRGRRGRTAASATNCGPPASPEAFLSSDGAGTGPKCVRLGAPGAEMHPSVQQAVRPQDHVLKKTFYSAFKSDELLRLLRVRFVTELFICGSSTNIGVMATAIDAASYGFVITIVDNCCGSQTMTQHRTALRQITSTTGCDTLAAAAVLAKMKPQSDTDTPERADPRQNPRPTGGKSPSVRVHRDKHDAAAPSASDIQSSLERLSLSGDHAAADEHAPEGLSQQQSPPALQPLAGRNRLQSKEQANRDSVVPGSPVRGRESLHSVKVHSSQARSRSRSPQQLTPPLSAAPQKSQADLLRPDANKEGTQSKEEERLGDDGEGYGCDSPKEPPHPPETPLTHNNSINTAPGDASVPPANGSRASNRMALIQDVRSNESDPLCEGDTKVIYDILPELLAQNIFERIKDEVNWQHMSHQGGEVPRLVAVQGHVDADGSKPIYRHPSDESPPLLPFTPAVDEIRRVTEAKLGHPLNHVLIQLYRHGNDYISEHSDKTLDIAKDSFIANVSLGAERTMTLRTKRQTRESGGSGSRADGDGQPSSNTLKRQVQRAQLPHNSLFQMGLATNMRWMHSIRQDKRLAREKSPAELAYNGARISLTFRRIGTFLDSEEGRIWGQGATAETKEEARKVINGQTPEAVGMLRAFGRENQSTEFDWETHYGGGFDVLHITAAARLFLSGDPIVNMRVQMQLAELGISYARGSVTASMSLSSVSGATNIKYVHHDEPRTVVEGERNIMLHLQKRSSANDQGRAFERFQQGLALLDEWRESCSSSSSSPLDIDATKKLLAPWETYLEEAEEEAEEEEEEEEDKFVAGSTIGLADFAFWPVLHAILCSLGGGLGTDIDADDQTDKRKIQVPRLLAYYGRIRAREPVAQMLATAARP